ncbi:hypothetical protein OH76DRAFT_17437 [Lentinus brumalis]|uniref:Uncharacterized protein n=1 Tax=Lentinus brumalis TaxID=2498619 RepID=A0A371DX72_9APHY|nr:hypothetical protein OH76DRAFT_17437 [Polyporus brumalis]
MRTGLRFAAKAPAGFLSLSERSVACWPVNVTLKPVCWMRIVSPRSKSSEPDVFSKVKCGRPCGTMVVLAPSVWRLRFARAVGDASCRPGQAPSSKCAAELTWRTALSAKIRQPRLT